MALSSTTTGLVFFTSMQMLRSSCVLLLLVPADCTPVHSPLGAHEAPVTTVLPCPPRFNGDFLGLVRAMGIEPKGQTIVNIGAAILRHAVPKHNRRSNDDEAWNLFLHHPELQLRIVAYEGNTRDHELSMDYLNSRRTAADEASRVTAINAFVSSRTIRQNMRQNRVPDRPLLLKLDIDSVELPIAEALLSDPDALRPAIIFAEYMAHPSLAPPLRVAALEGPDATYQWGVHYTQAACAGVSLGMWRLFAERHGYALLATDGRHNVVLVESSHRAVLNSSDSAACYGAGAAASAPTARHTFVERMCAQAHTPYTLVDEEGVCCPGRLAGCKCHLVSRQDASESAEANTFMSVIVNGTGR